MQAMLTLRHRFCLREGTVEASNSSASSCSGANRLKLQLQGTWSLGPSIVAGVPGFEYRNDARDHVNELFAVHSLDELRAIMEAISLQNAGNVGEQTVKGRAA